MTDHSLRASITDQPISGRHDEALDSLDYARAMADFIERCGTPLTIGIQGEWGSGKTSLMNLIREELRAQGEVRVATAWVNTWEHSLFRPAPAVPVAVMQGMLENLRESLRADGVKWPRDFEEKVESARKIFGGIARMAVNAAAARTIGVGDAVQQVEGAAGGAAAASRVEVAELKAQVQGVLAALVHSAENPFQKVVFFVDDLDRLEPPVAVSVLESLKNIFDIDHCVYVLAIDYDVVVKGLRDKFGEKTPENEREFRSFFDKIIQVPFSMPMGSYNIDRLLEVRFAELGLELPTGMREGYLDAVTMTVGANPRSIKRYLNTYSLLRRLRRMQAAADEETLEERDDYALFALIGLQVAYPKVYQLLVKEPNFLEWDDEFARRNNIELQPMLDAGGHELLDEPWEQFLYQWSQRDPFQKARAMSVLATLNGVRKALGDDEVGNRFARAMQAANITSVEEAEPGGGQKYQRVRFEGFAAWRDQMRREHNYPAGLLDGMQQLHEAIVERFGADRLKINFTPSMVSYSPLGERRGKVFLYMRGKKRNQEISLEIPLPERDGRVVPSAEPCPDGLIARLAAGYQAGRRD